MTAPVRVNWSTIYSALASDERRTILRYLFENGSGRPRDVAWFLLDGKDNPTGDALERTLTSLHHVHLPKLAAAGLVDVDVETEQVVPTVLASNFPPELISPSLIEMDETKSRRRTLD